jgi:hypothetical protein
MALNAGNARIFGSDDDKVQVAPLGSTLPTTLAATTAPFEDFGWLGDDGIPFTPSDSIEKFRGHQGGRVVRTTVTESDLTFRFQCLETKALTLGLQHNLTSVTTVTGTTTMQASAGRQIEARAFVIDLFDKDDTSIHYRYVIPRGEIGERSEVGHTRSGLTIYEFSVEVIENYTILTNDPAAAA